MKYLTFILILIASFTAKAQTDKITYKKGEIYLVAQDAKTKKVLFERPYGQVLSIEYDTFYKSYYILFQIPEGATGFGVRYIKTMEKGALLMQDTNKPEDFYYVSDKITENGILILLNEKKVDGHYISYKIINIDN